MDFETAVPDSTPFLAGASARGAHRPQTVEGVIQQVELFPDPGSGEQACRLRLDTVPEITFTYRVAPLSPVPQAGQRVNLSYQPCTYPPSHARILWLGQPSSDR